MLVDLTPETEAGALRWIKTVKSSVAENLGTDGTSVYVLTNTFFNKELSDGVVFEILRSNGSSSLKTGGSGPGNIGAVTWRGGIGRSKVMTGLSCDQFIGFTLVLPNGGLELVGPCNGTSFHFALQTGQI